MCKIFDGFVFRGDLEPDEDGYWEVAFFPSREAAEGMAIDEGDIEDIVPVRVMVEIEGEGSCCGDEGK